MSKKSKSLTEAGPAYQRMSGKERVRYKQRGLDGSRELSSLTLEVGDKLRGNWALSSIHYTPGRYLGNRVYQEYLPADNSS